MNYRAIWALPGVETVFIRGVSANSVGCLKTVPSLQVRSIQCLSFGMCVRRADIKLHSLPQEHFQAQSMALRPSLQISSNIIWDGD